MPDVPEIPDATCPPFAGADERDLLAGILLANGGDPANIPNTQQCREWGYGKYTVRDLLAAILLQGGGGGGVAWGDITGTVSDQTDLQAQLNTKLNAPNRNSVFDASLTLGDAESLGTTPTALLTLRNTTAAAAGAQQVSPSLVLEGRGWRTDATAQSQTVRFRQNVLPVQGTANPAATWRLQSEINASGTWVDALSFDSTVGMTVVRPVTSSTTPGLLVQAEGAAAPTWAAGGTLLAVNAASGFTGDLMRLQASGAFNNFRINIDTASGAVFFGPDGLGMVLFGGSFYPENLGNLGLGRPGVSEWTRLHLTTAADIAWNNDTFMWRAAANEVEIRNATNPCSLRVTNTWSSATNQEFGRFGWVSNVLRIGTEKGSGGGSARDMQMITDGINRLTIDALGHIIPVLPTSSAGLPTGALWNDTGTVKVA